MLILETSVNDNYRRSVELADPTLLDPSQADALEQGEWLTRSSGAYARVGASSVTSAAVVISEKGDYAAQAIGKTAILELHDYIGETDMFEDAGGGFSEGDYLTVKSITVDTVTRSGLTQAVQGTDHVYAICEKDPTTNDGMIGFRRVSPFWWAAD